MGSLALVPSMELAPLHCTLSTSACVGFTCEPFENYQPQDPGGEDREIYFCTLRVPPPTRASAMEAGPGETAAAAAAQMVLARPLSELTEEDIAQLTREDCRRYLKDKGMRRPSWNKSQAIQQVISLKALLEAPPDADHSPLKPPITRPSRPQRNDAGGDTEEPPPYGRRDPIPPPFAAAPRVATNAAAGQMTIFYGGDVNVYDGVPPDKVRAIMQIAASPDDEPDAPIGSGPLSRTLTARFAATGLGPPPVPAFFATSGRASGQASESAEERRVSRDTEPDGTISRKASLQRYLEKKKYRGHFKGKSVLGGSSSNMELMYLNQKFRIQNPNEQSGRTEACSPSHPWPPHTPTRSTSMENRTQKLHFSVDLNEDGGGG